jgi:AraC-like DNA-binding protein
MHRLDKYTEDQWREMARQCLFSATTLTKRVGVCERQLQRYTKIRFGLSPQKWLDQQRLICAADLIKQGNAIESLKRISYEIGFKQVSHFSRAFKEYHGMSPTLFVALVKKRRLQSEAPSVLVSKAASGNASTNVGHR